MTGYWDPSRRVGVVVDCPSCGLLAEIDGQAHDGLVRCAKGSGRFPILGMSASPKPGVTSLLRWGGVPGETVENM